MKRSLYFGNEPRSSKKAKTGISAIQWIKKLPRELIDHDGSYTSIFAQQKLLSCLGHEAWGPDQHRMRLWFSIFKSDQWLRKMVDEQNAKPVLVGSHLRTLPGKSCVILYICNKGRQFSPSWRLFRECLQDHTVMPGAEMDLTSGVTLNVQDLLDRSSVPTVQLSNPTDALVLREQDPVIQYSFYPTSTIQDIKQCDISTDTRGWCWTLKLSNNGTSFQVNLRTQLNIFETSDTSFWGDLVAAAERRK
jgi:hypothetical protein